MVRFGGKSRPCDDSFCLERASCHCFTSVIPGQRRLRWRYSRFGKRALKNIPFEFTGRVLCKLKRKGIQLGIVDSPMSVYTYCQEWQWLAKPLVPCKASFNGWKFRATQHLRVVTHKQNWNTKSTCVDEKLLSTVDPSVGPRCSKSTNSSESIFWTLWN